MIVANIIGGLGNQMFQYAAARALSLEHGCTLRLDITSFDGYNLHQGFELDRVFNCPIEIASVEDVSNILGWQAHVGIRRLLSRPGMSIFRKKCLIVEPYYHFWEGIHKATPDCYLIGYWQSEKYFQHVISNIREDFSFKSPLTGKNTEIAEKMASGNSVSLHVRRGDYKSNPKTQAAHGLCSMDYYRSAIQYIKEHIDNPKFYIFSDDISWVKENIRMDFPHQYVEHNKGSQSYNDMHLMSLCSHNIIANSTFSWWGAWLGSNPGKIVITPRKWFNNNNNTKNLIPDGWLSI